MAFPVCTEKEQLLGSPLLLLTTPGLLGQGCTLMTSCNHKYPLKDPISKYGNVGGYDFDLWILGEQFILSQRPRATRGKALV